MRQYVGQNLSNEERLIASGEILQQTASVIRSARTVWPENEESKARWERVEQAMDATSLILRGRRSEGALRILDVVAEHAEVSASDDQITALRKHIPLIVDIANAERPEDVQNALNAAAAPVGSWRIKQTEAPIFTITAFVGASGGYETPAKGGNPSTGVAGAMGSLGVDFTLFGGKAGELGIMGQVIDVGQLLSAPVDARRRPIDGTNVSAQAEGGATFELVQLLAPGANVHYGVPGSPIVVGAGYSIAPRLRKYVLTSDGRSTEDNYTVHRLMGFVAVDVTLFPL